ncbi:MAG: glycerol-3-phosphate dehydrogenase/oxidase [Promethearchaeota archaeon]
MHNNVLNIDWCSLNREKYLSKVSSQKFDLIIIGGGITGAGIAREAALRGLTFVILEKNDFAYGTSSRSSKLIHGGFRYLSNAQFKVVRESTTERNWLRVHFPNLVRPMAFNLYSYEDYMFSPNKIKIALKLYNEFSDRHSKFKNFDKPHILTKEEFIAWEPKVKTDKLVMGAYYYDNNVDDARLTLETIKESLNYSDGSSIALNYSKVTEFQENEEKLINGVKFVDEISGKEYFANATQVINATGIWTDDLLKSKSERKLIRPTKGVHLIIKNERLGNNHSFGLHSKIDNRFYFALRRENYSVIGTTDTDFNSDIDHPICTKEDCDYLLDGINYLFPEAHLTEKDIVSTYAGIRPLVVDPDAKDASAVSRKHVILDHSNGLVSLIGGKLTIYRLMGEDLIFHLEKKGIIPKMPKKYMKKGFSKQPFLVGITRKNFDKLYQKGINSGIYPKLNEEILERLHREYGKQAFEILTSIQNEPQKGVPFIEENTFIPAEIEWICKHEIAPHLMDILCRRTEISMYVHYSKAEEIATKVGKIVQTIYNWDDAQLQAEINQYVKYIKTTIWF